MIPIACPRCDRVYSVPPDRLNAKMHCKACDATFYMDQGGKIVLGDPGKKGKQRSRSYQPTNFGFDTGMGEFSEQYGPLLKKYAPLIAVVLIVLLIGQNVVKRIQGRPKSVEDYAKTAAEAFITENAQQLRSLCTKESKTDADEIIAKIRPKFKTTSTAADITPLASMLPAEDEGLKLLPTEKYVKVLLIDPTAVAPKPAEKKAKPVSKKGAKKGGGFDTQSQYFALHLIFVERDGGVYLDGSKTFELMSQKLAFAN